MNGSMSSTWACGAARSPHERIDVQHMGLRGGAPARPPSGAHRGAPFCAGASRVLANG
jgi:hypothetical protein